jgi:hypothetical protein
MRPAVWNLVMLGTAARRRPSWKTRIEDMMGERDQFGLSNSSAESGEADLRLVMSTV